MIIINAPQAKLEFRCYKCHEIFMVHPLQCMNSPFITNCEHHKNEKLINELHKLYEFLHGAHSASNDENASATFHTVCHKLQEIINECKNDNQ